MRRVLLVLAVGLLMPALAAAGAEALPRSFVGLYDEQPEGLTAEAQLGVGIVRQPFDWSRVEQSPGVYDWSAYDGYVAQAAAAGVSVMPVLARPPEFRSSRPARSRSLAMYPPRSNAAYADFVGAAVRRYGPGGSFWRERPDVPFLPVHVWQVWNEPNIPNSWRSGVSARGYVALLRAASRTIRAADPGAEVVAAGLPNSHLGMPLLEYLDAMSRLWITEFGWSTGGDASAFRVSERGQAERIAGSLSALIAERRALRLRGFVLFRWKDSLPSPELERDPWPLHAGLLRTDGGPKPGFRAFSRVVHALRSGWPTPSGSPRSTRAPAASACAQPRGPVGRGSTSVIDTERREGVRPLRQ